MNEDQIVASLAQKIPREPLLQKPDEPSKIVQEVVKQEPSLTKPTNYHDELSAMKLMDFFTIDVHSRRDPEVMDKLNYIYGWGAEQAKSSDSIDVMTKLRELEQRLGLVFRTGNKFESIYRWIKLDKQRRLVEKEMALV